MSTATRLRRLLLLAAAALVALVVAAVASADNVQDDVDDSSNLVSVAPGGTVAVSWRIHETAADGCSAALGAPAVLSISVSGPITASASSLTFASCESWQSVTFTVAAGAAAGDYPVTVSVSDADGDAYGGGGPVTIRVASTEPPPDPADQPPVVTPPADQVLEATSPSGASQAFSGTAVDDVDGALAAPCAPTAFPLGASVGTCTATDSAGNTGQATFNVLVRDTTPPSLSLPGPITAGATSPAGATVGYSVSAADVVAGAVAPACVPASGSTFPVGTTTVECVATDGAGNSATGSFTVTVTNAGPTVVVPGTQTVEAFDHTGATVNFVPQPTATDPQDGPLVPSCSAASGSRFPLGRTTVTCTATDSGGATGTASFDVLVRDTTGPLVVSPRDYVVVTDTPLARDDPRVAVFLSAASAADAVGVASLVSNAPAVLPLGRTVVVFTAFDASGNMGVASATIELRLPIPGEPPPPASPPPVRVPPANVAELRVLPLDRAIRLEWRQAARASRYVLTRTDRLGGARLVYDGAGTAFVDRGLVNGEEYRYVVVSYDAAGLRSVGITTVAVPRRPFLVSPRHGAGVSRPPTLTWRRVARASYYNVQLFRVAANGARIKVMSTWPVKNRLRVPTSWRYGRKTQRLSAGTYEWYLWAGFGRRASENYGPLLGWSRFVVRPKTR